jgi:polyisoprenoid-binding protein YceI
MKFNLVLFYFILVIFSIQAQNSGLGISNNENIIHPKNKAFKSLTIDKTKSTFTVNGTSTMHDWEMVSNEVSGSIESSLNNGLIIKSINLSIFSKSLKSGKKFMDKKCHEALKADDYPTINYRFNSIKKIELITKNSYKASLIGTLTIAGISKSITTDVKIELKDGNLTISTLNIKGKKPLKMSDFNIISPSAFFGIIKTGDKISITFNLNYI